MEICGECSYRVMFPCIIQRESKKKSVKANVYLLIWISVECVCIRLRAKRCDDTLKLFLISTYVSAFSSYHWPWLTINCFQMKILLCHIFVCNKISILQFLCYLIISNFNSKQIQFHRLLDSRYVTIFIQLNKLPLYCYCAILHFLFVLNWWNDCEKYTLCYSIQILFHFN